MKKKLLSLLLAFLVCFSAITLSGCVNTQSPDFELPEDFDGTTFYQKEIEIKFYHTMSATTLQPTLNKYIEKFNELYPNITITHSAIGGYDDVRDQLKTELSANNQPNMAYCYPDHVALYNKAKSVVALDDFISSTTEITRADGTTEILGFTQAQVDDFIEGYYEEGRQFGDGKMYSLPFSKSTEVLYYNKTFFDEHGLTVPTTWDEMYTLCQQIKQIDPECIPLGYDSESNWFITMCEQQGSGYTSATGDHFLFDNDENKEFVKMFAKWYSEGLVTTQQIYGAYTSGLFVNNPGNDGLELSTTEVYRSYMSIGSSAGATHQRPAKVEYYDEEDRLLSVYPFEVGIASIPQVDTANPKVISQGPDICIFKDDDPYKVIATWLFLKFLTTSVEFQVDFSLASGYVPVLKSVNNNEKWNKAMSKANGKDGIAQLSAKVCIEQEQYYFTSPAFIGSSTARDWVGEIMTSCIKNGYKNGQYDMSYINEQFQNAIEECEYAVN